MNAKVTDQRLYVMSSADYAAERDSLLRVKESIKITRKAKRRRVHFARWPLY